MELYWRKLFPGLWGHVFERWLTLTLCCVLPFPCSPSSPPLLPGHCVVSSPCGPATAWISTLWPTATVRLSATLCPSEWVWPPLDSSLWKGSKPFLTTAVCVWWFLQQGELRQSSFLFSFWEKALTLHLAKAVSIIRVDTSGKIPAVSALVRFYLLQIWRVFSPQLTSYYFPWGLALPRSRLCCREAQ